MFGSSGSTKDAESTSGGHASGDPHSATQSGEQAEGANKRSGGTSSPSGSKSHEDAKPSSEKKRRSSGVSKAKDMLSSAKQSLHLHSSSPSSTTDQKANPSPLAKMGKADPALSVPQGSLNNSAGESNPGPKSTFKVGVTEDRNKKCRRTMEDTHAYLYNFLSTPAPVLGSDSGSKSIASIPESTSTVSESASSQNLETDNGYFAIFDGHAGTFAADWCGKKLHLLLEDTIRKNPNKAIPELLDRTFTSVDQQLEKLPLKNSGCTAVIAVLRWEDRVPNSQSATGSSLFAPAAVAAAKAASESANSQQSAAVPDEPTPTQQTPPVDASAAAVASNDQPQPLTQGKTEQATATEVKLRETATRQRVLYTANVGDARIVLCRNGRALRLSYDHKGSDENEGRRVANAGGLILNNRVNGVLAVTRALGDAYMKDLVTGHPYTTETVIQPDQDEFLILACDGLWDVCTDQEAVDIVRSTQDPQLASKQLVDHALARFSTDNLSCMIVRFDKEALKQRRAEAGMGVDGDSQHADGQQTSEATKIVEQAKKGNVEAAGGTSSIPSEVSNAEPTAKVVEMQNVKEEPSAEDEAANNDQKPDAQANE